jgi:hypothetical protein
MGSKNAQTFCGSAGYCNASVRTSFTFLQNLLEAQNIPNHLCKKEKGKTEK